MASFEIGKNENCWTRETPRATTIWLTTFLNLPYKISIIAQQILNSPYVNFNLYFFSWCKLEVSIFILNIFLSILKFFRLTWPLTDF